MNTSLQADNAEEMTRRLAREEGIFAGISSGGAATVAVRLAEQPREGAVIVLHRVCDRGDPGLSLPVKSYPRLKSVWPAHLAF